MTWVEKILQDHNLVDARRALLESAELIGQLGSWAFAPAVEKLVWSDNMFRLYGLEPQSVALTPDYVVSLTHPDDRERIVRAFDAARRGEPVAAGTHRIVLPDGRVRHHEAAVALRETAGTGVVYVGSVRDMTDSRQAQREVAVHIAVSETLSRWRTLQASATELLRSVGAVLECQRGVLWVPSGTTLVARVSWSADSDLEFDSRGVRPRPGEGLVGTAWLQRAIVSVRNLSEEPGYSYLPPAVRAVLRGALAVPAIKDGEVLAIIGFGSREELELTERLKDALVGVSYELGEFLAHRHGQLAEPLLSAREIQVLELAAAGHTGKEIAARLGVGEATVKTHLAHIYSKLDASDRAAAVATALREGLIE